jgi:hypothetical protein
VNFTLIIIMQPHLQKKKNKIKSLAHLYCKLSLLRESICKDQDALNELGSSLVHLNLIIFS